MLALRPCAFVLFVAVLGVACSTPAPHAPDCPSGSFSGRVEVVEPLRQTPEGALSCPKYLAWGSDGSAPPGTELPRSGEASLDMERTRKRRAAGETDACCYRWFATCPAKR